MDDISRAIGRLQATMDDTRQDVEEIKKDVKALNQFKWRLAGATALFCFVLTGVVEFLR